MIDMKKFLGWFELFKLEDIRISLCLQENFFRIDMDYNEFDWRVIHIGFIPNQPIPIIRI